MKHKIINIFLVLILIIGAGIFCYPEISNWWNTLHASKVIAEHTEQLKNLGTQEYDKEWERVTEYNIKLAEKEKPSNLTKEEWEEYENLLNISGNGIIGYLEIEKLNVWLPVYHGTDESVLQMAAGHMEWTSLPADMNSCHTVIAAHSGLPSSKLFSKLDRMEKGETFVVHVLDKHLKYEVDQIKKVYPEDIRELQIINEENYCTLVTCTPYGINTHRLLVRGKLINETLQKE